MAEKALDKKEPTDAHRLALEYENSPYITVRVLMDIFSIVETEQEMGVHNENVKLIYKILGEGLPKVLEKMANVIRQNTIAKV